MYKTTELACCTLSDFIKRMPVKPMNACIRQQYVHSPWSVRNYYDDSQIYTYKTGLWFILEFCPLAATWIYLIIVWIIHCSLSSGGYKSETTCAFFTFFAADSQRFWKLLCQETNPYRLLVQLLGFNFLIYSLGLFESLTMGQWLFRFRSMPINSYLIRLLSLILVLFSSWNSFLCLRKTVDNDIFF